MPNDKQALLQAINSQAPHFITMLGGKMMDYDAQKNLATFEFQISRDFCHSVDVVQGGFVTAMLDIAMTHAVFAGARDVVNLSSLEIKTSYLDATRAGKLRWKAMF